MGWWIPFPGHTERSWIWDGLGPGDATLSPYKKELFNQWFVAEQCNATRTIGHVIPGYLNDLALITHESSPAVVTIRPGAAIVGNYIYENTEDVHFTVPPKFVYKEIYDEYRYDSIILQVDIEAKKTRLQYRQGSSDVYAEYATPYKPLQNNKYWEVELWRVHPTTSDPLLLAVTHAHVQDMRQFLPTMQHRNDNPKNLLINSEFMAVTSTGLDTAPDGWIPASTPTHTHPTTAIAAALPPMVRGRGCSVNTAAAPEIGIRQWIRLPESVDKTSSRTFTVEGLIQIPLREGAVANDRVEIRLYPRKDVTFYSGEATANPLIIGVAGDLSEYKVMHVKKTITFDVPKGETIHHLWFEIVGTTGQEIFTVGQFFVCEGYFTGGLHPVHETIIFSKKLTDTTYDGDALSTGTTNLDLTNANNWSGRILPGTRAIHMNMRARDSGSAGAADGSTYARILSYNLGQTFGDIHLAGHSNDRLIVQHFSVPVDTYLRKAQNSAPYITFSRAATAADTLDAWIEITGIDV